jgi:hypothetical protein
MIRIQYPPLVFSFTICAFALLVPALIYKQFNYTCHKCLENIHGTTISKTADAYALQKVIGVAPAKFIDSYMEHYKLEYTRLYNKGLTEPHVEKPEINFNTEYTFCFHEIDYDENCSNCALKLSREK